MILIKDRDEFFSIFLEETRDKIHWVICGNHLDHFLPLLLTPLLGRPRYCFGSYCETVGLTIGGVKLSGRKVAISFSKYFLWKVLISF